MVGSLSVEGVDSVSVGVDSTVPDGVDSVSVGVDSTVSDGVDSASLDTGGVPVVDVVAVDAVLVAVSSICSSVIVILVLKMWIFLLFIK